MRSDEQKTFLTIPSDCGPLAGTLFSPASPGQFPCVIFCHGAFEYKENFFPFAKYLAGAGLHAIALDMPGHGESAGNRFCIDIPLWVSAISATIDFLENHFSDDHRIGIFGFSSGGTAVLEAALVETRIKAIATLDATIRNYMGFFDTFMFGALIGIGRLKKRLTGAEWRLDLTGELKKARVAHDLDVNQRITADPRMLEAYRALPLPGAAPCAFVDTIERIDAISIPTLVMHGEEDQIDSVETGHILFNRLNCEKSLKIIPESGHCGHLDTHRNEIMQLTTDWMSTHL